MTVKQTVEITNKLGMHARPAMKLFELMQGFDAEVLLRNDEGTEAEANSVIALLMLDSAKGRQIEVEATGPQEEDCLLYTSCSSVKYCRCDDAGGNTCAPWHSGR